MFAAIGKPLIAAGLCWAALAGRSPADDGAVDFVRDIRPILAGHCFKCHGQEKQESGLQLDIASGLLAGGNSGPAVLAGKADESLLVQAISGAPDVSRMPPTGPGPSAEQLALLRRWINEGANVPADTTGAPAARENDHWSFQPLMAGQPPRVKNTSWGRNPIDAFILAPLEAAGLQPSPEADKATLARRVSLDLTGLPPTLDQVDEYCSDNRGEAYERLVDGLLNSPHYGERWGRHWLDIARYADSNGYTIDGGRSIWKYRDWVIGALNRDLPFDQFAIEQLAGDLLTEPSTDQLVATGFHRNTLTNEEGGTDPEQFRVEAVVDRVSTTSAAFLGLTVGCARCHDHKYDPISQREFYQLFAIFNNSDEPSLPVPTDKQSKELPALVAEIEQSEKRLAETDANSGGRQAEWESKLAGRLHVSWTVLDATGQGDAGTRLAILQDQSLLAVDNIKPDNDVYQVAAPAPGHPITAVMLEVLPHELLRKGPGRADDGNFVLTEFSMAVTAKPGEPTRVLKFADAWADYSGDKGAVAGAIDGQPNTGWNISSVRIMNVPRVAIFTLAERIEHPGAEPLRFVLEQKYEKPKYLIGRFRLSVTAADPDVLKLPPSVRTALAVAPAQRTAQEKKAIQREYLKIDPEHVPLAARIAELKERQKQIAAAITTTMIVRERKEPRATRIHLRGDFLRPGAVVHAGVPAVLPPMVPRGSRADRLDFARWLFHADNPLTARVTVNRIWQSYFGQGLVATENDFGVQGELPTHPELLDWLARQLIERRWSLKSLHRLIVTSATYRESSRSRADLTDPQNKLYARQQRLRLEAETIRDSALAASGLLSREIGGPGVYPPQPQGIYRFTQQVKYWGESKDDDRYRRGMYTFFWRSSPYPFLKTFDAPDANVACTRRARSNTPLQALTMANDRAFFEIAQCFAASILSDRAADDAQRIRNAFRRCFVREPSASELAGLTEYLAAQRTQFANTSSDATAVVGSQVPAGADLAQAAAWTMLARVLLNLDEFITRE